MMKIIWPALVVLTTICTGHKDYYDKRYRSLQAQTQQVLELLREINSVKGGDSDILLLEKKAGNWLDQNDILLAQRSNKVALASWNYETNLTDENAQKLSEIDVATTQWVGKREEEAKLLYENADQFQNETIVRMLEKWIYSDAVPVAKDPDVISKISSLGTDLSSIYGNAVVEKDGKTYRLEPELLNLMADTSTDYDTLQWAWISWRSVTGPKIRSKFTDLVKYMNEAATDNDYNDLSESWMYSDFETTNIEPMLDDLYQEVLPLYQQLHAYVRSKLIRRYQEHNLDPTGPIPAHILGNMWAQEWENIYDLVVPFPDSPSYDVTDEMKVQGYTPEEMFKLSEQFFTSIGMDPMTDTFWEKSMIVRPEDRPVQCHASASDMLKKDDFRIKMCTEVDMNYLQTIHHEMGHIEYYMQYQHQPTVFRSGANAAFHEAIGDTIALSVMSPEHLQTIGLLKIGDSKGHHENVRDVEQENCFNADVECTEEEKKELNGLMKTALAKIAFLPFGYLIDKWRWNVFRGTINDGNYNTKWWEYRETFQGISPPVERTEADFDPGAKYHVAAFVPYSRYFLSFIAQFQFHEALCDAKGHIGPLNHCDIYQSTDAGDLLTSGLELGGSRPWPDVMDVLTGQRDFNTDAIYKYFGPLYQWLQRQNSNSHVGW